MSYVAFLQNALSTVNAFQPFDRFVKKNRCNTLETHVVVQ